MQGRVLDFSVSEGSGIISGDDGNRYSFVGKEWKEQEVPTKGQVVDFDVDESNGAVGVYFALSTPKTSTAPNLDLKNIITNIESKSKSEYSGFDWFLSVFKKYATFSGRAHRKEFWYFQLFYFVGIFILTIVDLLIFGEYGPEVLSTIFVLACVIPALAVSARRLHDINKSGWWQLLYVIPIVGAIILIIWFVTKGNTGNNQYGPDPLLNK